MRYSGSILKSVKCNGDDDCDFWSKNSSKKLEGLTCDVADVLIIIVGFGELTFRLCGGLFSDERASVGVNLLIYPLPRL